jgi:hypothetical protein
MSIETAIRPRLVGAGLRPARMLGKTAAITYRREILASKS